MSSGKKGDNWHFGIKLHVGVDTVNGIVHMLTTTVANVHNIHEVDKLRRASDNEIIGDSGYLGMEKERVRSGTHY